MLIEYSFLGRITRQYYKTYWLLVLPALPAAILRGEAEAAPSRRLEMRRVTLNCILRVVG